MVQSAYEQWSELMLCTMNTVMIVGEISGTLSVLTYNLLHFEGNALKPRARNCDYSERYIKKTALSFYI